MSEPLHMMKLCVGADRPEDLEEWQQERFGAGPAIHVTRMRPKRAEELWPAARSTGVPGVMLARQRLLGFEDRVGADGITRCALVLDPQLVRVAAVPRRPSRAGATCPAPTRPRPAPGRASEDPLPPELVRELAEMGLL